MEKYNDIAYKRNRGFWSTEEQKKICESTVSIAGVGGDGFGLGLGLVQMGVQNLNIADPESFERENSNRVIGATVNNYNVNKAVAFMNMAKSINPDVNINIFEDGVTMDNVEDFMQNANLLIDESELRYLHIATMLARTARKLMIPNLTVMNIGFAGVATSFHPEAKQKNGFVTFESLMGLPDDVPIDEVKNMDIDFSRYLPYLPSYGDLSVFEEVKNGAPFPSIIQGVNIAAGLGTTQAFLHLIDSKRNHRPSPTWAPEFIYNDAYLNKSGVIEIPRASHYSSLAKIVLRSVLNLNPHVSYSKADREMYDKEENKY